MSITMDTVVTTPVKIPFVSRNNDTGLTVFDLIVLKDGVVYTGLTIPPVFTEIGEGLYTVTLTFSETGEYTIFVSNAIAAYVRVTERSLWSYLNNIESEALGSWQWNKQTGVLTLYSLTGSPIATYTLTDNNTESKRQKTS